MAGRKKRIAASGGKGGWIVTFSDLMTLLLAFFVLLLSMSSMDAGKLARISSFESGMTIMNFGARAKVSERIKLVMKMIGSPQDLPENQQRIKDLLFFADFLPPEISKSALDQNVSILEHPEGVVIILTGDLLFAEGSPQLDNRGKALLGALTPVIQAVNADINISGYTDTSPGRLMSNEDLSALRAVSALEYFLHDGVQAQRFSVSGYGPDKPLYPNSTPENRGKNRRIEILLKTANRLAGY